MTQIKGHSDAPHIDAQVCGTHSTVHPAGNVCNKEHGWLTCSAFTKYKLLCCPGIVQLQFFTSTAAALPCEVGPDGRPLMRKQQQQGWQQWLQPSKYQQAWARRMERQKAGAEQA